MYKRQLIDSAQMHRVTRIHKGTRKNLATSIWKNTPQLFKEHENWHRNMESMTKVHWQEKESN